MSKRFWQPLAKLLCKRRLDSLRGPANQLCRRLAVELLEDRLVPSTLTVTTVADSGIGSFRQAIHNANVAGTAAMIRFNIPGPGLHTITPKSSLPALSVPVNIDGFSQPGASSATATAAAVIEIRLDGTLAGLTGDGLILDGGSSTLWGLAITNFQEVGLVLGGKGGDSVTGDTFTGSLHGNVLIQAAAANNVIGAATSDGGVVATGAGIGTAVDSLIVRSDHNRIQQTVTDGILVTGNFNTIGGDPTNDNIILRLTGVDLHRDVIAGNRNLGGIRLVGSSNVVEDDYIGTDSLGAHAVGNNVAGLVVSGNKNVIGGILNFISGNNGDGVDISGTGNQVLSNIIGLSTSRVGQVGPLGNSGAGVRITGSGNTLNGNVISANLIGITLAGEAARNTITANRVGTPPNGGGFDSPPNSFGNIATGILITGAAHDNTVGGTTSGSGNVIAFTQGGASGPGNGDGVFVQAVRNNPVLGNSIFSNAGLAIEDAPLAVAAPVISSVNVVGITFTLAGTITGPANSIVRVEIYSDTQQAAQGETFLGAVAVTTDTNGQGVFSFQLVSQSLHDLLRYTGHAFFTATATLAGGTTSPFSAPAAAPQVPL
jgi:parallel beta-helix repeat protein